jgi:hypothetical protein
VAKGWPLAQRKKAAGRLKDLADLEELPLLQVASSAGRAARWPAGEATNGIVFSVMALWLCLVLSVR